MENKEFKNKKGYYFFLFGTLTENGSNFFGVVIDVI